MNKAKILASLGPASADKKIIRQMVDAGMDAARINTSHGDIAQYHSLVSNLREVKDIPIMLDTQGPEIRFRCKDPLSLSKGDQFEAGFSSLHKMYFVPGFLKKIKPGTIILFEDGLFRTKVKSISKDKVTLRALTNGRVFDKVKVNIPSLDLNLEILTKEDLAFIDFAKKEKLDFIALSFTRTAKDVMRVRKLLHGSNIGIISKIENAFGIKNFDEILDASDGIMVARGDLGVEIPSEKLPVIQKQLILKCNQAGKFVITATQMLQSMVSNPTPTRAETSDVANAILDGSDVIMLSGETSIGKYPVLAVKEMTKITRSVQGSVTSRILPESNISTAISHSVAGLCHHLPITRVVALTSGGFTARMISRFRLRQQIIAITPDKTICKALTLYYGIEPMQIPVMPRKKIMKEVAKFLQSRKMIHKNDLILFTGSIYKKESGSTNLIEIHSADEILS